MGDIGNHDSLAPK